MNTTIDPDVASTSPLETEVEAFADASPPFLYDLGPEKGREAIIAT